MKKILLSIIVLLATITSYGQYTYSTVNVTQRLGLPRVDTTYAFTTFKTGELRVRPQDSSMYRFNGRTTGRRWDKVIDSKNLTRDTLFTGPRLDVLTSSSGKDSLVIENVPDVSVASTYLGTNSINVWGMHPFDAGSLTGYISPSRFYGTATDGYVPTVTGGVIVWNPPSGTGITSLNTLTPATQTFATGTSGTDFAINSATSTHTFNIPSSSAANRGLLLAADWTTFNNKQAAITLTTTGTSGAATLTGATLNIPQYAGSQTLQTTTTLGNSTTDGIVFSTGAGTGRDIKAYATSTADNLSIITYYPNSGTNASPQFDFSPRGTGFSSGNRGTISLYNSDVVADAANSAYLRFRTGTTIQAINSGAFGTGTTLPLALQTASVDRISIAAAGAITFNSAYTFPTTAGTANQNLSMPASGTQLVWTSLPTLTATTYTPTVTTSTNCASATATRAHYMRIGNVVHVSGHVTVTPSTNTGLTIFRVNFPVASNTAAVHDVGGTANCISGLYPGMGIQASVGNDDVEFTFYTDFATAQTYTYTYTYYIDPS